jgi:hypothetical protein
MLALLLMIAASLAPGWTASDSPHYQASIDRRTAHAGHASATIRSAEPGAAGFAVSQRLRADAWRNQRVRISGWLRTEGTDRGGALWVRIDMANGDYILDSFLESAAPAWTKKEVVAPIPADAVGITFGVRLAGKGQVWADDFEIATVPPKTMTTTIERRKNRNAGDLSAAFATAPRKPLNLGFEN